MCKCRQNRELTGSPGRICRKPAYCPDGVRYRGGVNVVQALVRNVGTYDPNDNNGKVTSGKPARTKVQMQGIGAEQSVVVMKFRNGNGAKGLYYLVLNNGQPKERSL